MFQKIIGLTVLDFENVMEEILITIMIMTTYLFKILRGFAPISVFFSRQIRTLRTTSKRE